MKAYWYVSRRSYLKIRNLYLAYGVIKAIMIIIWYKNQTYLIMNLNLSSTVSQFADPVITDGALSTPQDV